MGSFCCDINLHFKATCSHLEFSFCNANQSKYLFQKLHTGASSQYLRWRSSSVNLDFSIYLSEMQNLSTLIFLIGTLPVLDLFSLRLVPCLQTKSLPQISNYTSARKTIQTLNTYFRKATNQSKCVCNFIKC